MSLASFKKIKARIGVTRKTLDTKIPTVTPIVPVNRRGLDQHAKVLSCLNC